MDLNDGNGMLAGNAGAAVLEAEYLRIAKAAGALGWSSDDLLHLGAIGKAELLAPVFHEGVYEWHVSAGDGEPYPEYEPGFRTKIGLKDRVVLLAEDLAKIEAMGWARPTVFFYPSKGREIARHWNGSAFFGALDDPDESQLTHETVRQKKFYYPNTVIANQAGEKSLDGSVQKKMEDNASIVPWILEDPLGWCSAHFEGRSDVTSKQKFLKKTTIEHLFLSKQELERLKSGIPQDEASKQRKGVSAKSHKPHGNAERFSSAREEILIAAITCFVKASPQPTTGTEWAELVDQKARVFWKTGNPPLSREVITRMLNANRQFPDKPAWEGKNI